MTGPALTGLPGHADSLIKRAGADISR